MRILKNDEFLGGVLGVGAFSTGAVTLAVFLFLLWESFPLLKDAGPLSFFMDDGWSPTSGRYNLTPMLVGSLWATSGAVLLATPLGLAAAIFQLYYAPKILSTFSRAVIWLLAGIPSVVYGFWGLTRLVPLINEIHAPGLSLMAGILILALMILPTAVLTSEAALAAVPESYRSGARALGLGRWAYICFIAVPAAKKGILAGILLEIARALGETMAVIMVMGNTVQFPKSPFDTARTLTANIALEMSYALGNHRRALFVSGLLVLFISAGLFIFSEKIKTEDA